MGDTQRMPLKIFTDISHHAFQDPADSRALAVLQRVPLLPLLTRKLSELTTEGMFRLHFTSSAVRVGPSQYPTLHKRYVEMAKALDIRKLPALFLKTSDSINAFAAGQEDYFIVVYTGLMDLLTEDELLAIIAHELGHIKCDHMMYKNMATLLTTFGTGLLDSAFFGVGQLASIGFQLSLLAWSRKAEFSCDRAALLGTQDRDVVCSALAKLAGFTHLFPEEDINIDALRAQAKDYDEIGASSMLAKIMQINMMLQQTHPFPVVRVDKLADWADSEEYARILRGEYIRNSQAVEQLAAPAPLGMPAGVVCEACTAIWPRDSAFCGECRANLARAQLICGACHSDVKPNWIACPDCGNLLRSEQEIVVNSPNIDS